MKKIWEIVKSFFTKKREVKKEPEVVIVTDEHENPDHFSIAMSYLDTKEIKGRDHNSVIVNFFKRAVGKSYSDETPWCAAFVGSCLAEAGLPTTRRLNARSYLEYGYGIIGPKKGDILVFWRGSKTSWKGHVAFYYGETEDDYLALGGNQNNCVCIKKYPKSRLLGMRRA